MQRNTPKRRLGLWALVAGKLGRCSKCMAKARAGTVLGWAGVAGVSVFWPHPLVLTLAMLAATSFTLVLMSHMAAITFRDLADRRRLRRARAALNPSPGFSPERRQTFGLMLQGGVAAVLVSLADLKHAVPAAAAQALTPTPCPPKCDCYFSSDCQNTGRGLKCDWTWNGARCDHRMKPDIRIGGVLICSGPPGVPKCDGLCRGRRRSDAVWHGFDLRLVGLAADLYFTSYLVAGQESGGPPNPKVLRDALAVPIPDDWHLELQETVHDALDVALGWDFARSFDSQECFGEIPRLSEAAEALVNAAREGMVTGLFENDPEAIGGPIQEFWSQFPDYPGPVHQGRCYHTHDESPPDPASCQIQELGLMLQFLLEGRESSD